MADARLNTEMEGRCMKCKAARPFTATEVNVMKNGGSMAKGTCGICGTTICRMLGKLKPEGDEDTKSFKSLTNLLPGGAADEEEETF